MRKATQEKIMRLIHQDRLEHRDVRYLLSHLSRDHAPNGPGGLPLKLAFDMQAAILRYLVGA